MAGTVVWSQGELDAVAASNSYADFNTIVAAGDGYWYTTRSWHAYRHKRRELGLPPTPMSREVRETAPGIFSAKRLNEPLDWREANRLMREMKALRASVSRSQHFARIEIPSDRAVPVLCLSDTHIGAWSNDHDVLEEITDQILAVPDLKIILLGDMTNMAISLRGVAEGQDDILPAELQEEYLAAWLNEIGDRVVAACWGNHDAERQETFSGYSSVARLLGSRSVYTSGIAHIDLKVGDVEYPLAITHKFRGRSVNNPCAGAVSYLKDHPSRNIAIGGDSHVPGIVQYSVEGTDKIALQAGSTQTASGYARRYFSLFTEVRFPVIVLDPDVYAPRAYYDLADWIHAEKS